jgi:general secretion pathway protein J
MRHACARRLAGFTLIEMLIAIAIFGIMAGFGYRVLDTVLVTRDRVGEEYRRWRDVARVVGALERDLEAIRLRPVRDAADRVAPPLVGIERPARAGEAAIAFTREGDRDEWGNLSAPRRTGYRLSNATLERLTWQGLDAAPRSEPSAVAMLSGVKALQVRYRNAAGQWLPAWPGQTAPPPAAEPRAPGDAPVAVAAGALPAAVEVTIELATGERILRLIPLSGGGRS